MIPIVPGDTVLAKGRAFRGKRAVRYDQSCHQVIAPPTRDLLYTSLRVLGGQFISCGQIHKAAVTYIPIG